MKSESEVAQSCPTVSDPMNCSPPSSSIHGIFQARVLEWGAIAFSEIYISIITLNGNGLNVTSKRRRLAEWIQKPDLYICCLQKTHFRPQDTYRLKVRRWKNIFHANGKQKKAEVAILISDKIDLKIKKITRDKKGHYIMIKGSIQEEDMTIVNIYAPIIGAPQYIRQTLTDVKGEMTVTQ